MSIKNNIPKKIYMIAGEASGDLHGSKLVKEILKINQQAEIRAWGGDKMKSEGATVVKHFKDLAFMGFVEVIKNLGTIIKNFKFCKEDILKFNPDVVVLIDYPGFNLRMAKWIKENGFRSVYYIAPQAWAWKEKRVNQLKKYVDDLIVILPFEKKWFEDRGCKAHYVGHPLIEFIEEFKLENQTPNIKNKIALLPGSRKQEIKTKLPIMLQVVKNFLDYKFIVVKAPGLEDDFYIEFIGNTSNVELSDKGTYNILNESKLALVTSGTATLETALLKIPQIVCYKGSKISYLIAKKLIKVKFISLVNLIADKLVVKELIQNDLNYENLVTEMNKILTNSNYYNAIQSNYDKLYKSLSTNNKASESAAHIVMKLNS